MLSAAVATWLLTFAYDYTTFLLAALGVGIAGGSFAVGIAYVSRWYPGREAGHRARHLRRRQCRRRGDQVPRPARHGRLRLEDGGGTSGRSASSSWRSCSGSAPRTIPSSQKRRKAGLKPEPISAMLAPLKKLQVWRFSLYYFFVFGGFVALALWLPHYYVGVYGLDIVTAGLLGAAYSIPGSLFRILGGTLSDKYGARRVMYWTFIGSVICTFFLSYPATTYVVERHSRADRVHASRSASSPSRADLRPRLLHEPRQGRRLQAHPGLLPRPRRLGRRRRRPDRRARRLRAADRLRRHERSRRRVDELLHAAVHRRRRVAPLDALRHPATWRSGRLPQLAGPQYLPEADILGPVLPPQPGATAGSGTCARKPIQPSARPVPNTAYGALQNFRTGARRP